MSALTDGMLVPQHPANPVTASFARARIDGYLRGLLQARHTPPDLRLEQIEVLRALREIDPYVMAAFACASDHPEAFRAHVERLMAPELDRLGVMFVSHLKKTGQLSPEESPDDVPPADGGFAESVSRLGWTGKGTP